MGLPVFRVEIAGHAALDADPIGAAAMTKRTAQVVLPATQHSLHQPFGCVIKSPSSLGVTFDLSAINRCDVLHFKPPQNFLSMCSRAVWLQADLVRDGVCRRQLTNSKLIQAASAREMERTLLPWFW